MDIVKSRQQIMLGKTIYDMDLDLMRYYLYCVIKFLSTICVFNEKILSLYY